MSKCNIIIISDNDAGPHLLGGGDALLLGHRVAHPLRLRVADLVRHGGALRVLDCESTHK